MNDQEKDRDDEIPELKMEKDVLGESAPEVESGEAGDASDFTVINEEPAQPETDIEASPFHPPESGPDDPVEVEIDDADITIIEEGTAENATDVDASAGAPGGESPDAAVSAADAGEPDFEVLDYRDLEGEDDLETPALNRKVKEITEESAAEKSSKDGFSIRTFKAGDIIFKEGDPGDEAYLILSGKVKITRGFKNKSMKINELGKDQIFGEMAIITGEARTATAKAMEPTNAFIITEKKLQENLSHNLAIIKNLIDQLIGRVKQLLEQQSTMIGKVERSLLIDKKLEVIKAQIESYRKKKTPEEMDEKLTSLLESILKI